MFDFCPDYFQVCQYLNDTNNPSGKGMMLHVLRLLFKNNLSKVHETMRTGPWRDLTQKSDLALLLFRRHSFNSFLFWVSTA